MWYLLWIVHTRDVLTGGLFPACVQCIPGHAAHETLQALDRDLWSTILFCVQTGGREVLERAGTMKEHCRQRFKKDLAQQCKSGSI